MFSHQENHDTSAMHSATSNPDASALEQALYIQINPNKKIESREGTKIVKQKANRSPNRK